MHAKCSSCTRRGAATSTACMMHCVCCPTVGTVTGSHSYTTRLAAIRGVCCTATDTTAGAAQTARCWCPVSHCQWRCLVPASIRAPAMHTVLYDTAPHMHAGPLPATPIKGPAHEANRINKIAMQSRWTTTASGSTLKQHRCSLCFCCICLEEQSCPHTPS